MAPIPEEAPVTSAGPRPSILLIVSSPATATGCRRLLGHEVGLLSVDPNVIFPSFQDIGLVAMQRIGFIVFPGFQVMSFGLIAVFEVANIVADRTVYEVHLLSERGGPVR